MPVKEKRLLGPYLAGAALIALLVFSPAVSGSLVFDDLGLPFANPNAAGMPAAFWIGGSRPVLMVTYWANFLISGVKPLAYHLTNELLHSANAVLVAFVLDALLAIASDIEAEKRRWLALFGAVVFLVHPLQTEAVDYIAGRSELVAGFFFLAAWLVFLRNFRKKTTPARVMRILAPGALAVLSKESAISLAAVLLLTDISFPERGIREQLKHRMKLYSVIIAGTVAGATAILLNLKAASSAGLRIGISPVTYALTECHAIFSYLRLFVLPAGQNADWQLPFAHGSDAGSLAFVFFLLMFFGLILWLYRHERLIGFGLAAFLVMLAPTSSFIPIADAMAERRMYLPILGLIIAVVGGAIKMRMARHEFRFAALGAFCLLALLSFHRSNVWASDLNLWTSVAEANPANSRAHFGIGTALLAQRDCSGAAEEFRKALARNSADERILWNEALSLECANRHAEGEAAFRSYAASHPTADAYDQIGLIEARLAHFQGALEAFNKAIELNPNDAAAYAYRGLAMVADNRTYAGIQDFRHALAIDPNNQAAAQGLAAAGAAR